ncbi:hypothetical protein H4R19_002462 [Coemansia spiralis]|nr:hypothetical protein H4R19_002462 [Coemansia spiralis]
MLVARVFGLVALAAAAVLPGAAAYEGRSAAADVDAILYMVEQNFKNPEYAQRFAEATLASTLPPGAKPPTNAELYAALESMPDVVPALVADAVDKVGAVIAAAPVPADMDSTISQTLAALHDPAVIARLTDMVNAMLVLIKNQYKDAHLEDQSSSEDDDSQSCTSSASRAPGRMYAAAIAAAACAVPLFM